MKMNGLKPVEVIRKYRHAFNAGEFIAFALVGILNTVVDLAVLNLLLFLFGTGSHDNLYAPFKAIAFLAAVANSYVLNKWLVFRKGGKPKAKEPVLFLVVSIIGFFLNTIISTLVFNLLVPLNATSITLAATVGALVGSAAVFLWNYAGYKFVVFERRHG
ncbi:MAG: GtrA family protein [Minisyncoccia bacterium]